MGLYVCVRHCWTGGCVRGILRRCEGERFRASEEVFGGCMVEELTERWGNRFNSERMPTATATMREGMPRECTNGRSSKLACIHWSNQLVALEGLLCMLRPSQGGSSILEEKEYDTKQLRMKLRKDCLNFLVANTDQVQKTPGRGSWTW